MKRNTINITSEIYNKLKDYCKSKGLKINWFIEKIISDTIISKK